MQLVASSPHPTPSEWLAKAIRRLNEPGGFVYVTDLTLIADIAHALSVTLESQAELLAALKALRDAVVESESMDGRQYVGLGIQVNSAIAKAENLTHGR